MATTNPTGGWPDATNTGVPAGVTLTPSGDLVITQAGAVISGLDIKGTVYINAPNVTLMNCKVTAASFSVVQIAQGVAGTVVKNCEINGVGSGNDGSNGINGQGTFIGNNIYNVENGFNVTGSSTIQGNYIHGLQASGSPHYDGIQIDGGVSNTTISHNTIINSYDQTSAIMIDNYFGPISNISVDNNLLVGGGYTVYSSSQFTGGSVSGVSFTNNHMGTGVWGVTDFAGNNPVYSGNVNDGAALVSALNTPANVGGGGTPSPTPGPTAPGAPTNVSFSPDSGVVGGITSHNTVTLTGTAVANSTVKVFDGTTQIGTTTANSSGAWTYKTATLIDGSHKFTATDTSSGLTSVASSALSVSVATQAAAAPPAPVLVSDSIVNTNHVLLTGTAQANTTIKVFDGTTLVGTTTTGANGAWSVTTSALAIGSKVLTATATDAAGKTSVLSQPLDPVIGSPGPGPSAPGAPVIASFSPDTGKVGDGITDKNMIILAGTAVANSTVKVFDGSMQIGTATANGSGAWTFKTAALADGSHKFTATDTSSGLTSVASSALSVTVDTHAPAAPTVAVYSPDGKAVSGTTTVHDFLLKGTAEANSTINIFDSGKQIGTATTNGSGSWSFDTGHVADGNHSFSSKAIDVAGNVSTASAAKGVAVHTSTSTHTVGLTDMQVNSNHTVTIKGTADAFSQIKLYDGNTSAGTVTTKADGTWSFTSSSAVSNKMHTFKAQETDSSGHVVATSGSAMLASSHGNTMTSTTGNDVFVGHGHHDTFVFAPNFGHDVVTNFTANGRGHDVVQFSKSVFDSFANVLSHATQSGQNVVITDHTGDSLTLKNIKLATLDKHDFHFA